jgi:hypothetical protein
VAASLRVQDRVGLGHGLQHLERAAEPGRDQQRLARPGFLETTVLGVHPAAAGASATFHVSRRGLPRSRRSGRG